jgi:hypothetical protein
MKSLLYIINTIMMTINMTLIMTACQAEKLIDDTGVHFELEVDKPSDLPPCSKKENHVN